MNPTVAGRLEGLLLAAHLARNFVMLDPDQAEEMAGAMEQAALQIASTDLLQRFTIQSGVSATLEANS